MLKQGFSGLRAGWNMFFECVKMSVKNIMQNRMRSFLTILGILIGVTAVIALITTINGVSASISDSFSSMGAGTLSVSISGSDLKDGLTPDDLAQLCEIDNINGVTPTVSGRYLIARGGVYESSMSVSGKNGFFFSTNPEAVLRGRAINTLDERDQTRVCLISRDVMEEFFYGEDPLGQEIYLDNIAFTVVGVFDADVSGGLFSGSADILAPYTTLLKLNSANAVTGCTLYLADASGKDSTQTRLEAKLDEMFSYEEDCYEITDTDTLTDTMDSMLSMMSALLAGIASIALVVGGIGIMNMMLTSVTERTMEIGLRKAIGARPEHIQLQFLSESFLLSMAGGIAGIALGLGLSVILCKVIGTAFSLSWLAIALGAGFSAAVGILFGWAPARRASRLNPIDALRSN